LIAAARRVAILDAIKTRRGASCSTPIDTAIKQTAEANINFFSFICVSCNVLFYSGHPSSGPFRPHSVTLSALVATEAKPFDGRAVHTRGAFLKIAAHPPSLEETKENRPRPVNVFSINQMELDGRQAIIKIEKEAQQSNQRCRPQKFIGCDWPPLRSPRKEPGKKEIYTKHDPPSIDVYHGKPNPPFPIDTHQLLLSIWWPPARHCCG